MRCTTFQDGSNWSILEGVCEPRSTPSSVKGVMPGVADADHEDMHKLLKTNFDCESYLLNINDIQIRSCISRLRLVITDKQILFF
jgi:hypothetical protein